jgi:hypothetical protein
MLSDQKKGGIMKKVDTSNTLITLTRSAVMLSLLMVIQYFRLPQLFTGTMVNALLLTSLIVINPYGALMIAFISPWLAFMFGILPQPLLPLIPFIMLGNSLYVLIFWLFFKKNNKPLSVISGIALASIVKFLTLSSAVRIIGNLAPKIAQMMIFPQLITAVCGGILFLLLLSKLVLISKK